MKTNNKNVHQQSSDAEGLYILMLTIHGLVRSYDIELGKDPDSGGQIKYVIELIKALSALPQIRKVDLLTRCIIDKRVDASYSVPIESINDKADIIRIPCGPKRYFRKENLWPYLDSFVDNTLSWLSKKKNIPDIIHGHYADAGYVGSQLSRLLGVPFIFTGHSLGRTKKQRLLAKGQDEKLLESRFHFANRIEAEEMALVTAAMVVTSTNQEVKEQYELYEHYVPERK
jgi:sucrose-phosphate synthase